MEARVERLFVSVTHRLPMREVDQAVAVENKGLDGCLHGRPGSRRQVLLMDAETLEALGLAPGVIKENVTTRGLRIADLALGQRLRVGGAMLEVTIPCQPCEQMDAIRPGLRSELRGRRGMLCRVLGGARIARGDAIELLDRVEAAD